jgi:hypothetical protein
VTNPTTDDSDGTSMLSRRNILLGLGGAGAGTLAGLDTFTDVLDGGGSIGPEDPPLTNPNDDDDAAFQTPWNADSLVIGVEWNERDSRSSGFFDDYGDEELGNAVAFWNDYIDVNAAFDLTLTFEHHHDNPDILLKQATVMDECGPEYDGPGFGNPTWSSNVCLETLRETPTDDALPVTGTIGPAGSSTNLYRLIAQHAIGRLLGYDIWTGPVDVMNPKILITPSHRLAPEASGLYHAPERSDEREHLEGLLRDSLAHVQNPSNDTQAAIEETIRTLNSFIDSHNSELAQWHSFVDELGVDVYAETYEETVLNDELAYMNETIALITDVLDTYTQDELADGPDELEPVGDRLETLTGWPGDSESYELQIHRYVTDAVWSVWAAEQRPTPTESA